jgi:uncharacterized membrane-anchored protein
MSPLMKYAAAALVALAQTGVLGYIIESRAQVLRNGQEIVLKTQPVDPRDLMRGDYVTLGYDISNIDVKQITGTAPTAQTITPVYVAVKKTDEIWAFSRASWQPILDKSTDEVVLKGQTNSYFYPDSSTSASLTYGIEQFYVPQGEGRVIEDGQREQAVDVLVAVSDAGVAQLKSLRLDGKTLYDEPLY